MGQMRTRDHVFAAVLGWMVAVVPVAASARQTVHRDEAVHCEKRTVSVSLSEQDPTPYSLVGWLCSEGTPQGKTVQLLMSGFTYDHTYWDFPFQPGRYSYVHAAVAAGYATFNVDRLGVGLSDKPPAAKVTVPAEGYVAHQLVQKLRNGEIDGVRFSKVIGVGHSMGAEIWMLEASKYNDVDGLILADYLGRANQATVALIATQRYTAQEDPKFAKANLPAGYLATRPGGRSKIFYNAAFADPKVIDVDEQTKATATSGEGMTLNDGRAPGVAAGIKVPVLLVVGEKDTLACDPQDPEMPCEDRDAILDRELVNFTGTCHLGAFVLPESGHDTNLHPNAYLWFLTANAWSNYWIGPHGNRPARACHQH